MTTITINDTVFATATFEGRTVAAFSASGFSSISDVLKAVRKALGGVVGMVRLSVRNASRGWRQERSMYIAPLRPGVQLTLF